VIPEHVFRAYDIRGIFNKDITLKTANLIGKGFGTFVGENRELIVGRDIRLSGEILKKSLIDGLTSVGCNVIDIDLVPTPILYFMIVKMNKDGGVMCSASHNPSEWNGFKLCGRRGYIYGQGRGMEKIKEIIIKEKFNRSSHGKTKKYNRALEDYSKFVLNIIQLKRKLKIVLDTCNSVCGLIAPKLFEKLGCEVTVINEKLDGNFPGHDPEPNETTLKELSKNVKKECAELGVGYDGDGDRAVFVDDKGRILSGDVSLIVLAKDVLKKKKNAKIVFDVGCSSAVEEFISKNGGVPIVERVGRAFIMDRVLKENADLGGEKSSHFYFPEVYGFDDGVFASLRMTGILSESDEDFSQIVDSLPKYYTSRVKKIGCQEQHKFEIIDKLKIKFKKIGYRIIDIDGIKVFDDYGWVLIRPSNTEPVIKINAEAKTKLKMRTIFNLAEEMVREEISNYG